MMDTNQIATKADIQDLKIAIQEIQKILSPVKFEQKILRSVDVRKLLNISDGTLQRLRITNSLPAQKVNGTWFYKYEDVVEMLNNHEKR